MRKLRFNKFFLFFLLLPSGLLAQEHDITGLWKGEMYVDSTKQYLPFELSISEVKGKLLGYSHITFEENGKKETGLRDVTIQRKNDQVIIEDVSLLDNSFSFTPPKNIKKTMVVTLSIEDTVMILKGSWSTNRTKRFLSATGTVQMQRKNDFKETVLFKKLEQLKLEDKLVFNEPEKKPATAIATKQLPKPVITAAPSVAVDPDAKQKAEKQPAEPNPVVAPAGQPIAVAPKPAEIKPVVSAPLPPVTTVPKPTVTKPAVVTAPPPAVAVINKPVEAKKAPAVVSAPTVVATPKPVEIKRAPPVVSKPAPPAVTVVDKPVVSKPVPQPVIAPTVAVEKARETAAPVIEKKPEPVVLPSVTKGAADIDKRTIATSQAIYYQSDSLVLTLYDNGYVDGDTVSVVMNGQVIFSRQGLSTKAVSKTIYITKETPDSIKLVMYAENLGSIPPNTGLLVVHDGDAVYDVRFSADLKSNAQIILQRKKRE
jgi:hypothetical protein